MDKPRIEGALGLAWRPRKNGWAAVWLARQSFAEKGYKPATRQISVHTSALTEQEEIAITAKCLAFQEGMIRWGGEQPKTFGGTFHHLITAFRTDPDSNYPKLDYDERRNVDNHLRHIDRDYGALKLSEMTARHFKTIYKATRWPDGNQEERGKVSLGYARMATVRRVFSFGMVFEIDPNCTRLRPVLSGMQFENGRARTEAMTLRQCEDVIAAAHAKGLPSIALAQAIQFDWRVRQRDVIGQWMPVAEPGISTIPPRRGRKWLRGMRHEEISSTLVISHIVSKTRKKRGELLERDLSLYPMVKAEYDRIPAEKRSGPLIICELTGRPWKQNNFRQRWRECATAAGVPKGVWNMDSRAGGITETIEATGGNLEAARKEAGHTDQKMTTRYSRRHQEAIDDTAAKVLDFRTKNKA